MLYHDSLIKVSFKYSLDRINSIIHSYYVLLVLFISSEWFNRSEDSPQEKQWNKMAFC